MTLTVEDGSGTNPNAEAYCTVAYADSYHASLGNEDWAALTTEEKEQDLRKGTNYLTQEYGQRWAGYRTTSTQALDWPRVYVPVPDVAYLEYIPSDVIPKDIQDACASLGRRAITADSLHIDETRQVVREKVDVIEIQYSEHSTAQTQYTEIENMLGKYLVNQGESGALPMVRV